MRVHRYGLLPVAIFLFLCLLPLGARSLITPDETRYAEIPREMIATGDWIVPHLNGVRYLAKPAMLIFLVAGRENTKYDTVIAEAAVLPPIIFLTCFEVFGVGNTAVLDNRSVSESCLCVLLHGHRKAAGIDR